ncbi:MAG: hypothetical protein QN172_11140 [Armatimonadota bacterium]|nr:hypothetical protein [Armatimonadota bacterium]MDR7439383.1 hypothetical protein [Armatimonadota bacterium]MDR7602991.1 hypothetical protein [Armatimonadota bacterium]
MSVLVDPTGGTAQTTKSPAPRIRSDLQGARVGLVDNGKRNAEAFLRALGELLQVRFGVQELHLRRKPNASLPAPPELVEDLLARCDVVIAGVGD